MKPVMYHYVRPCVEGLPYFPYLALADFERQFGRGAQCMGLVKANADVVAELDQLIVGEQRW